VVGTPHEAHALLDLGNVALAMGEREVARERLEEALDKFEKLGDGMGQASCFDAFGELAFCEGNYEEAARKHRKAMGWYRGVSPNSEAESLIRLGDAVGASQGDGMQYYVLAFALSRQIKSARSQASCMMRFARYELQGADSVESAMVKFEEALAVFRRLGALRNGAECVMGVADCVRHIDKAEAPGPRRTARARIRYQRALELYRRAGDKEGFAKCTRKLIDLSSGV